MYESHASLRDDFEVSCKELDLVSKISQTIGLKGGIYGCRMTGGGFGGCAVALVKSDMSGAITQRITAEYKAATGLGATIFGLHPSEGAKVLKG
jgi:galactokinase